MIKRLDSAPPINLARTASDPELLVDLEAFFDFSFWMAEELQDLICEYQRNQFSREDYVANGPKFTSATDNFEFPYESWVEWE